MEHQEKNLKVRLDPECSHFGGTMVDPGGCTSSAARGEEGRLRLPSAFWYRVPVNSWKAVSKQLVQSRIIAPEVSPLMHTEQNCQRDYLVVLRMLLGRATLRGFLAVPAAPMLRRIVIVSPHDSGLLCFP
jgi:hypothetical protein